MAAWYRIFIRITHLAMIIETTTYDIFFYNLKLEWLNKIVNLVQRDNQRFTDNLNFISFNDSISSSLRRDIEIQMNS